MLEAKSLKWVLSLLVVPANAAALTGKVESRTHPCFHDHPTNVQGRQPLKRSCNSLLSSLFAVEFVLDASNTKGKQDDVGVRHAIRSGASPKPPRQDQPKNPNQPDWVEVENNDLVEFVDCEGSRLRALAVHINLIEGAAIDFQ